MKYLFMIYEAEPMAAPDPAAASAIMAAYGAFGAETARRGAFLGGEALQPVTSATTVRVRDGAVVTTDGPFAETKEQLGGFYLLECQDLDEAIEFAAMIPGARTGSVEVRPIYEMPAEYQVTAGSATSGGASGSAAR